MQDAGVPDEIREAMEEERSLDELQSRVERSRVLRLEAMLARRPPGVVLVVGLSLLGLVGVADAASGEFTVEILYLVPIGLVTFGRGWALGLLVAGLAALVWGAVEVQRVGGSPDSLVTSWNALTRFLGYAAVALLIAPMRNALVLQRRLAETEAEAVERMRAMEELREAALQPGADDVEEEPYPIAEAEAVLEEEASPPVEPEIEPDVEEEPHPRPEPRPTVERSVEDGEQLLGALSDLERDARRDRRAASGA
jgi:hypothetical protein